MLTKQITIKILAVIMILTCLTQVEGKLKYEGQVSQWEILNWNEEITVAWDWGVTSFKANISSLINYTLNYYNPSNFTHPSAGEISIGNLTIQTTNNKTAEVLILSIWGWFPGLITSTSNWNLQKDVAQEAAQGQFTNGTLQVNELNYNYAGDSRNAINFSYSQDPLLGNQNTTLIYDKKTGVLLEGITEILFQNSYVLHLKLVESDLISSIQFTSWSSISIVMASAGLIIGLKIRRIKKILIKKE